MGKELPHDYETDEEIAARLGLTDDEEDEEEENETEDLDSAFEIANEIAPEHLELELEDAKSYLEKVEYAGAVLLGKYSPEPLGDYIAGPNHTLPTSGSAKYADPLGVYDFLTRTSIIHYSREDLEAVKDDIVRMSDVENLTAHGNSIKIRFGELKY